MSHLLGAQDCVENLRRDVIDLQGALVDVFSRTGPVRFRSWKFPDKESCDLDLVQLLEQYDYVEGEKEFNEHSHTVLLELVIDRLLLLLQSFNAYMEQMLGGQRAGDCGKAGGPVCVGLVVRRYWKNLISCTSQQRQQKLSVVSRPESSTESDPRTSSSTSQHTTSSLPAASCSLQTSPTPSLRCRSVSCQTVESALVPCAACAGVQSSLQDSARAVASLCQALGLSCSLWSFLQAVEETLQLGRLSACDLTLWAREQQADLRRIHEHVTHVQEKAESLTHTLQRAEEERDELRARLDRERESSEREREERRRREDELERRLEEEKLRRDEELKTQREEKEELRKGSEALEVKISELEGELKLQRESQQCVEHERDSLVGEVYRLHQEEVRWKETEQKKRNLESELSDTRKLLDTESAKYHSSQRQHEAMTLKQRALLERTETLVQQCEELQVHLDKCEDEKAELTDTLTHTTQEKNTLQEQLTEQKSEFLSLKDDREKQCVRLRELEDCVSRLTEDLQQSKERERILVAFPELNPQPTKLQSTGDVLCDMEQQLKVNSMRIRVLEQENVSLIKTLAKLKDAQTIRLSAGDQTPGPNSGSSETARRATENPMSSSFSSSSSSTVALHHQTLSVSVVPEQKRRPAARTHTAVLNRRRK
ncbi:coiled-coil domain-containing protein 157-like isoform X1 [Tachysurus fulvidraco]|uniref:coiled-coil domain-containing protein 157-like isoform X1 n=2 Tax=Tachysurus fulvidraco TaxID=1234273 RepID=UPI001FF06552|nr:coiled-coil domain-containing protein 157-like isoform X1 [Tachysurus fulvidraco]